MGFFFFNLTRQNVRARKIASVGLRAQFAKFKLKHLGLLLKRDTGTSAIL